MCAAAASNDGAGPLLEGREISRVFGGVPAVDQLSFTVQPGEILGLIGPNGAGKTTLVNLISGALPPSSGEIRFQGRSISGLRAHQVARIGIARTFQVTRPFPGLTVRQN